MQRNIEHISQQMMEGRFSDFWKSINTNLQTVKDTMTNERFADGQRAPDLKRDDHLLAGERLASKSNAS